MGLFESKEQVDLSDPGEVAVAQQVAAVIPDAGEYFLGWIGDPLNEQTRARLEAEIAARRAPNGWLTAANLTDVPALGRKQTPLTFLRQLVGGLDAIHLGVWGSFSLNGGKSHKALKATLENLVRTQGHGAAATWAIVARPEAHLRLEDLSESLHEAWQKSHDFLRNKDIIKAFRNWNK